MGDEKDKGSKIYFCSFKRILILKLIPFWFENNLRDKQLW